MIVRQAPAWLADIDEFKDVFFRRGWRGIERNYGRSSGRLQKVIALCGGLAELQRQRAEYLGRGRV